MTTSKLQLIVAGLLTLSMPLAAHAQDHANSSGSWTRRYVQARAQGMDTHDASRVASIQAPATKPEIDASVAWMRRHKEAMERGMTHQDASAAASLPNAKEPTKEESDATRAWMRRHKEAMDRGLTHQDASREADRS